MIKQLEIRVNGIARLHLAPEQTIIDEVGDLHHSGMPTGILDIITARLDEDLSVSLLGNNAIGFRARNFHEAYHSSL